MTNIIFDLFFGANSRIFRLKSLKIGLANPYDPISGDIKLEVQSFIEKNKKLCRSSLNNPVTSRELVN